MWDEGLSWFEALVVVLSLVITLCIGLYFSQGAKSSIQEYMLGGRNMTVLPISLSMAATYLTGSALISTAQEIYLFGTQFAVSPWNYLIFGISSAWISLPVSYSIKSASSFEFFDRRFNSYIRKFASVLYIFETVHHTAMSQYVPALSLSQATGLPSFTIACILSLICLAYTVSGGLKAVAWADSFQALIFVIVAVIVFIVGGVEAGGPWEIWRKGVEGSRMEYFNFDFSVRARYSIPGLFAGGSIVLSQIYLSPSFHQRVASMPSFQQARAAVIWSSIIAALFIGFNSLVGLVMFTYFSGCDPVLGKKGVHSYASIVPFFVKQIAKTVPGVEGLFLSGVLAAGLSTTTSCWNTTACTVFEDFIRPMVGQRITKRTSLRILMAIVVVIAIISTAFIRFIQTMSSLLEATLSLKALTVSIHFILYNGGMFLPWINSKGIFAGSLGCGALTCYIVLESQRVKRLKLVRDLPKILTTSQCLVNATTTYGDLGIGMSTGTKGYGVTTLVDPSVPWLLSFSFMWYMVPGVIVGLITSCIVSFMTGSQDLSTVDRRMIVPMMHWALPKSATALATEIPKSVSLNDVSYTPVPPENMPKGLVSNRHCEE